MLLKKDRIKEYYLEEVRKKWLSAEASFPDFLTVIPDEAKAENERYIQSVFTEFQKLVQSYSCLPFRQVRWRKRMQSLIHDLLSQENVIGIHNALDSDGLTAFYEEMKDFLRHVRRFAPELSLEDIGQALRNYIVYAMFKVIHQSSEGFSLAGFGYSMLYPFTDNYIDSKSHTTQEKAEYNDIIRAQIEGRKVVTKTVHQKKTCDLLRAIESEYPRDEDNSAYLLLLMMLEAQENSIRQQHRKTLLTPEERLDISLYKGGISVLIDRFFVRKGLNDEELILYLGFGFFLQLADDLQDIKIDSEQGYQTILTVDLSPVQEERIVNRMLNFVHNTLGVFRAENNLFKNFVLDNCYQLILTSVVRSREFFSPQYLQQIEQYLPVKMNYLEQVREGFFVPKHSKLHKRYLKILDQVISDRSLLLLR